MWTRLLVRFEQDDEAKYRRLLETDKDAVLITTGYDEQLLKTQEQAKKEGSRYSAIFNSPHCVRYIRSLLRMSGHFRHTKHLKLSGLQKMTDGTGGVSWFLLR
jgi:hypothetical protein